MDVSCGPHGVLQEKDEFVENIKEDIKAMGLQHEPITYTSDYFEDLRVTVSLVTTQVVCIIKEVDPPA